jgi:hemoglobin
MDQKKLPYELIGGRDAVSRLVDRFYDLMETEAAFSELRAMHADDLMPMRESLTDFLTAWLGGPRDWFEKRPEACIMSAHGNLAGMGETTARQWLDCMEQALTDSGVADAQLSDLMLSHMRSMAMAMAGRAKSRSEAA